MRRIHNYWLEELHVQDPDFPVTEPSSRLIPPADIIGRLRGLSAEGQIVGYKTKQTRPYNLLSLPSFSSTEPCCLAKTDATRVHYLLRINRADSSHKAQNASWSLLAVHIAISLPHQDHDGLETFLNGISGYKFWVFWPDLKLDERADFIKQGMDILGSSPRYIVLDPDDQYVQTPVLLQDVHAVVAIERMHYWHAHFMADSVRAATDELKSYHITNQDPNDDLEDCFEDIELLMNGSKNSSLWGGQEACARFRQAKQANRMSTLSGNRR